MTQDGRPAVGYPRVMSPERRPQQTEDGLVHMLPYQASHWARLLSDHTGTGTIDPSWYANQRAAIVHSDSLYRELRHIATSMTTEGWLAYCREAGIPATPVATLQGMIDELELAEHPTAGRYRLIPAIANFATAPGGLRRHAPRIGENNSELDEMCHRKGSDETSEVSS